MSLKPSDYWSTPDPVFAWCEEKFGPFELDVCATVTNAKCPVFFTENEDGLKMTWSTYQTAFCNPPYSNPSPWVEKASEEAKRGCTVVCLLPGDTSTRWYHKFIYDFEKLEYRTGVQVIPWPKRIRFVPPVGLLGKDSRPVKASSARFPNLIVVFRPHNKENGK